MIKSFVLEPTASSKGLLPVLTFDWDSDTGVITGDSAENVHKVIGLRVVDGQAQMRNIDVYEFTGSVTDSLEELAVIFGNDYILPPELEDAYPESDSPTEFNGAPILY